MATLKWVAVSTHLPPVKERLLLVVSAAGLPPDIRLMGQSDIEVGYWTGDEFKSMVTDLPSQAVSYWALLGPCIPKEIQLKHERKFDPDVRG